jgi:hypothetical protein
MDIKIPLPFKTCLFDEEMKEPTYYLSGIPKSFLIKTASLFLSYKANNSKYEGLFGFLDGFFCSANKPFVNRILSNILTYETKMNTRKIDINDYVIHQRLADLEFLKIVFNSSKENNGVSPFNIKEVEVKIFKAYVAINQSLNQSSNKIQVPEKIDKPADLAKFFFLLNLNSFDLNNFNLLEIIITQYYKGCLFMKFLDEKIETKELLKNFINHYGVDSVKKYISFLSVIHLKLIQDDKITHVVIEDVELFEFYKKHSLFRLSKINQVDYNDVRSLPLITQHEKGRKVITVIDSLLTAEMFYNGLYFRLKKINDSLVEDRIDLLRLKTHDFSEKLLFKNTIESIFGKKYIQFSGDRIDDLMDGGIDYYVRNGNKVFVFESKDIFLSSKAKVSFDEETVLKEIKTKLYHDCSKSKDKGILQIRNFIEKMINKQIHFDQNYRVDSINIYPILVLHNRIFNAPGFNLILQDLFKKSCDDRFGNLKGKINPLIVIDIDTLIFNHEFFESGKLNFEEVLKSYSRDILIPAFKIPKRINRKKSEELLISFSEYLKRKTFGMKRHRLPEFIAETAKEVLPEN